MGECIQPEYGGTHQADKDQPGDAAERQQIVTTAHPILDGADISFDFREYARSRHRS
jgi:hypothetical protein